MHEVLVNRLRGLSLPRKSVVRLTDRPDMTLDVYRGRKTTMQQQQSINARNINIITLFYHLLLGLGITYLWRSSNLHLCNVVKIP